MSTMASVSQWLAATPFSVAVQDHVWLVPLSQSIHILAIGIVMSSIAMLDLRLAGMLGRAQSVRDLTLRFYPWIWGALGVLVATGVLQIMAEPKRELLNWIFWTKMILILVSVAVTMPVRSLLEDCRFSDLPRGKQLIVRSCAFASLLFWVAVVVCGRWIAYAGAPAD